MLSYVHLCSAALPFTNVFITDNEVQVQHQQYVCKAFTFLSIYLYYCNFIHVLFFYNCLFTTLSPPCPLACPKQLLETRWEASRLQTVKCLPTTSHVEGVGWRIACRRVLSPGSAPDPPLHLGPHSGVRPCHRAGEPVAICSDLRLHPPLHSTDDNNAIMMVTFMYLEWYSCKKW